MKIVPQISQFLVPLLSSRFILVTGCQRSGTTLTFFMLTSHPRITGLDETHSNFRFPSGRVLAANWCRGKYTCYKLPEKTSEAHLIKDRFRRAKIVWLIRHPYAVISSMRSFISKNGRNWIHNYGATELKRHDPFFPELKTFDCQAIDEVSLAAHIWKYKSLMIDVYRDMGVSVFTMKFEQLVHSPEPVMKNLLYPLGIRWDDSVIRPEDQKQDPSERYWGKSERGKAIDPSRASPALNLDEEERKIIDDICHAQMHKHEYSGSSEAAAFSDSAKKGVRS